MRVMVSYQEKIATPSTTWFSFSIQKHPLDSLEGRVLCLAVVMESNWISLLYSSMLSIIDFIATIVLL